MAYHKKLILFILIILCIFNVHAIDSGDSYQVANIIRCYGTVDIRIWGKSNITNDFNFKDCVQTEKDKWQCECNTNNNTYIILQTLNTTYNIYDIVIQYFIQPKVKIEEGQYDINSDNKRTLNFNNIIVTPKIEKKEIIKFKMPDFNLAGILMVGIFIFVTSLLITLYYIWKNFMGEKNDINLSIGYYTKERHKPKELKSGDAELDDFIKKL